MFDIEGVSERLFYSLGQKTQINLFFVLSLAIGIWLTISNGWYLFAIIPLVAFAVVKIADVFFPKKTEEETEDTEEATVPIFPAANDGVLRGENDDRPL